MSHQRKLKSYKVETHWYQHYAHKCNELCPVPKCLAVRESSLETYLLLSDLSLAGYSEVRSRASIEDVRACLSWLAHFHGTFLGHTSMGLWECGSYWHLDTRPDELAALDDEPLKKAAPLIDQTLKQCCYQTLVHGDAKLANFCFTPASTGSEFSAVAAVDFQYVGAGCGMKDVAYFLGSCLSESECGQQEEPLLNTYFQELILVVREYHPLVDVSLLETEWRGLYDVAWADFHRFLKGWSPGHWKLNSYSERLTQRVVERLLSS